MSITKIYEKLVGTNKRTALIRKNILLSLIIKGWSTLVVFLLVPITLKCLGTYANGVWLTISSLLVWIDNLDIGLGNGLRNKLAMAIAHNQTNRAKELVSSTFFMLLMIIVPTMILLTLIVNSIDLYSLLNINPTIVNNINAVCCVSIICVCGSFVFKFVGNFYQGMQLPAISNMIVALGQTLTLVLTYAAYYTNHCSLMHIAIINTLSPLFIYVVSYIYTFGMKYRRFCPSIHYTHIDTAKSLFTIGLNFFVLQIAGVVLFFTSNIIISRLLSPAEVTPYQIVYRYFSVIILLFSIISTPYWSATTDAYEKKDLEWIKKSRKEIAGILIALYVVVVLMVCLSRWVYPIWVGNNIEIPTMLTIMVAIYVSVLVGSLSYSYFLNGIGVLYLQMILTTSAAVVFIPLTYLAFRIYPSIYNIILIMSLVNVPSLIINKIQFQKIVTNNAHGIWLK